MIDLFVKQTTISVVLGYEKKIYNRKISRNIFRNNFVFDKSNFSELWKIWRKESKWQQ